MGFLYNYNVGEMKTEDMIVTRLRYRKWFFTQSHTRHQGLKSNCSCKRYKEIDKKNLFYFFIKLRIKARLGSFISLNLL